MYKLTFDDKPEANTYVKWARQKGYLVEGPYREKLSKNVKKFDLNGKRKKFNFVVLRKRGAGREGGDVSLAVLDETKRKKMKAAFGGGASTFEPGAREWEYELSGAVKVVHPKLIRKSKAKMAEIRGYAHTIKDLETIASGIGTIKTYHGAPAEFAKALVKKGANVPYKTEDIAKEVAKTYDLPWREFKHFAYRHETVDKLSTAPAAVASRWAQHFPQGEVMSELNDEARILVEAKKNRRKGESLEDAYNRYWKEIAEPKLKEVGYKGMAIGRQIDYLGLPDKLQPKSGTGALVELVVDVKDLPDYTKYWAKDILKALKEGELTQEQALQYWGESYQDMRIDPKAIKSARIVVEHIPAGAEDIASGEITKLPSKAKYSSEKKQGSPKGSGKEKEVTGKIPAKMQPLAQEAAKYDKFEDFEKAFSHEIRHGRYYHVTDNPNFKIDSSTGPQDASSMAGKPVPAKGKLMITSDLDNWAAEYKGKRQYVAIIDMSEVPKEKYWQVNRGFGNEFWVDDPSKAKVIKVVPMSQAKVDSRLHHKALPSSKEKLMDFYEKIKEQATQEFPIQPEIKKVMTGAEPKTAKKEPWQMTKKEFDKFYREGWVHRVGEGETATKGAQLKGSFKKGWFRKGEQTVGAAPSDQILLPKETKFEPTLQKSKAYSRWEGELPPSAVILSEKTVKRGAGKPELIHASIVAEAIKEKKHVPLKVLREHRDVVKEEIKERKKAKAEKERVREDKERAEKAEKEEAKYWEETKLTKEQQSRDEEVEALKAEAEAYEKEEKEPKKEEKEVAAHE